jgi:hypothetical protein
MPYTPPPPPPPPASGKNKPLGVPEGYTVPRTTVGTADVFGVGVPTVRNVEVQPRYFQGAEYVPASLGPERIAQVQRVLAEAGLIGKKTTFRLGVWDAASSSAYKKLLEFANANGVDEGEALAMYLDAPEANGAGGSGLPAQKRENPDDLHAVVDTVARARLGRKVPDQFVQRVISAYQQAEAAEAAAAAGGGSYTAAPSVQTLADQMIGAEFGGEANEYQTIQTGNEFFDLLAGTEN